MLEGLIRAAARADDRELEAWARKAGLFLGVLVAQVLKAVRDAESEQRR